MAPKKVGKRGLIIHSQAREIRSKVLKFMQSEAENGITIPVKNYRQRVMAATGISKNTYQSICREARVVEEQGPSTSFVTPRKTRPRQSQKLGSIGLGEIEQIRQIIYDFVLIEKRRATLNCILQKIKASEIAGVESLTSLWRLCRRMGFRWKKTEDNRKLLVEKHDIRLRRITFLKKMIEYRKEGRPIVYTDETYIHSSYTSLKCWYDETSKDFMKPVSKGQRLIIVHAGGRNGFVPNALLIFKSGGKTGDYHDDMNHRNFMKWVQTQLLPNLPKKSVLVVDNAAYHNVRAEASITSATKKMDMIHWLTERKINHDEKWTKAELYAVIKENQSREPVKYVLDEMLQEHGHSVLRLPPYHPELNPIEYIWATVKNWVGTRNVTFKLKDVEQLARQKLAEVGVEEWQAVCNKVLKTEELLIEKEHLLDAADDSLAFSVNTGSSDDKSEDEDASSSSGGSLQGIAALSSSSSST